MAKFLAPSLQSRLARAFAIPFAGLGLCGALAQSAWAEPPGTAHGLIIKLKDDGGRTAPPGTSAALAVAPRDGGRWQRVLEGAVSSQGPRVERERELGRSARLVRFERSLTPEEAQAAMQRLQQQGDVEWVVPNEREHALQVATPDDPLFGDPASGSGTGQWWLYANGGSSANAIGSRLRGVPGFQTAWSTSVGSAAPMVAVLDTGTTSHPDLDGHVWAGYDFVSTVDYANDSDGRDPEPFDPGNWVDSADKAKALYADCKLENSTWHGTIIAGIIAAASGNGTGVAGISWNGSVLSVRVAGKCGAEVADIIDGMRWAAGLHVNGVPDNTMPARVINISFGSNSPCNPAYQDAIDELRAHGAVVVAAAGNEHTAVYRPANCSGVIAVAALNRDGFKASYSNFGPQVTISTVGGDDSSGAWGSLLGDGGMLTLSNDGTRGPGNPTYDRVIGTSFAVPVVSGTIGLMLAVNPGLSVDQIIAGLRASARPHVVSDVMGACSADNPGRCICNTTTCGAGILDAPEALRYASDPAGYVAPNFALANIDGAEVLQAVSAHSKDIEPAAAPADGGDSGGGALDAWASVVLGALAVGAALLRRRPQRAADEPASAGR